MKLLSFRAALLAFVYAAALLLPEMALAGDRGVSPNLFYHPPNQATPRWASPAGALSYYQGLYSYGQNFRIEDTGGTGTINGLSDSVYIAYDYTPPGGVIQHGGASAVLEYECPVGADGVFSGPYPNYTVTCEFQSQTPEPPCEKCQKGGAGSHDQAGNPIFPATGTKQETAVDYAGGPANSLQFVRTYRSDRSGWTHNFSFTGVDYTSANKAAASAEGACHVGIGTISRDRICTPYLARGTVNDFSVRRSDGRMLTFGTATDFKPLYGDVTDRLSKVLDTQGNLIGWQVVNAKNDSTELYDLNGHVTSIKQSDGRSQTFAYSNALTLPAIAPRPGLLLSVTDNFGYQLSFTYDSAGRMSTMTSPDAEVTTYAYDEASSIIVGTRGATGNLTSVTYPGGRKRIYWYNEQDKTDGTNLETALTGITDENGNRYATFTYNYKGQAISTEHAGGVEKYVIEPWSPGLVYVTDPLGQRTSHNFDTVSGVARMRSFEQKAGAGSPASTVSSTYDAQGNVATTKDANGNVTTYVYDLVRNLETSRTEGSGKPEARTITTEWHPTLSIAKRISEPLLRTTMTFDTTGNVLTRTIQATTDANGSQGFNAVLTGTARTWTYTYNSLGQVLTETSPRTDVVAKTTYTYDSSGNVKTITNAAGHVTTINTYDANGRPTMVTGPNGQVMRTAYLPRGWVQSTSVSDAGSSVVQTTTYTYDDVGQVKSVTMPDQSATYYTYDAAHRLTDVTDSLGNKIHYTLDNMGKRTGEQVTDPSGTLARQITRQYDVLSRLQSQTGGL